MDVVDRLHDKDQEMQDKASMHLLSRKDIDDVLRLLYEEGWVEFGREDLEFMIDTSPRSCFKFVCNGHLIGVTFATELPGQIFYPNSILIDIRYRQKVGYYEEGVKFLEYIDRMSRHEVIYAAERLVGLYSAIGGYEFLCTYCRLYVPASGFPSPSSATAEIDEHDLDEVSAFAREIYHSDRDTLFRHFHERGARGFVCRDGNGGIEGFALVRQQPKVLVLGPVIARSDHAAMEVMAAAAEAFPGEDLQINGEEAKLTTFLSDHRIPWKDSGAKMAKMTRGDREYLEDEHRIYGIFSHYIS